MLLLSVLALSVLGATVPTGKRETLLRECRTGGPASCTFLSPTPGDVYPQRSLIGNPFSNCISTQPVKHTISGSATVTDSWGVSVTTGNEFTLGIPQSELSVTTTVGHSREVTMSQSIEFEIPPNMQTALIGVTKFQGLSGKMLLTYPNRTSINISNTYYFQYTGEPVVFQRMDLDCDQSWPDWNTTSQLVSSASTIHVDSQSFRALQATAAVLLAWSLS
ncbi:hypothetical protein OPQ81_001906 [Rhizoctonia solani]|nr:hypothetical protein OPQ81_001906 [Rhizoctonia solani]